MTKTEQVHAAWVQAMKDKDAARKNSLSLLMSALKGKAKDKCAPLTPEEEDEVIVRELKQARETLSTANGRQDIIDEATANISVIEEFAPKALSEDELRAVIKAVLDELGIAAPTAKDKGTIMRSLMPRVKGKADGAVVTRIVEEFFN